MKKSNQLLQTIIDQLQLGNSLTSICRSKDMPNLATIYKWMNADKDLKEKILDARRIGAMTWLDRMQDLLDQEIEPTAVAWAREKLHHDKVINENVGDPIIKIVWDDGSLVDKGKASAHALRGSDKEDDKKDDKHSIN